MNPVQAQLVQIIRESGEGWLLDVAGGDERGFPEVKRRLDAAYQAYERKYHGDPSGIVPLNDGSLIDESKANPHKVRALLQSLASSSPEMVALIWRIVNGDTVKRVDLQYAYCESFRLHIDVEGSLSGSVQGFDFTNIEDAAFLRHLGIMRMDDKPLFDGYYALNIQK